MVTKKNFKTAFPVLDTAFQVLEKDKEKEYDNYLKVRILIGECVLNDGTTKYNELFLSENLSLCQNYTENKIYYAKALFQAGTYFLPIYKGNNMNKSKTYLEEGLDFTPLNFGKINETYLQTLNSYAVWLQLSSNFQNAESTYLECLSIAKEIYGVKSTFYALVTSNYAVLLRNLGKYKEAEEMQKKCLEIRKSLFGEMNVDYAATLNNLGALYHAIGRYEDAEKFYRKSLEIKKELFGEKHIDVTRSLSNLGAVINLKGDYNAAEKILKKNLQIVKELFGIKHRDYAMGLINLALHYRDFGRYEEAAELLRQSVDIFKESNNLKDLNYAKSIFNLAEVVMLLGDNQLAEKYYKESLQMRLAAFGNKHLEYATALYGYAGFNYKIGNFTTAETLLKECLEIRKEVLGEKNMPYSDALATYSQVKLAQGQNDEALRLLAETASMRLELFGENHIKNIESLDIYTHLHWKNNDLTKSYKSSEKIIGMADKQIQSNFQHLSEKQKELFFNEKLKEYFEKFSGISVEIPNTNTASLYNSQLLTKAILMQASQKVKARILSSGDTALIQKYGDWIVLKNQLAKAGDMSKDELKAKNINFDSLLNIAENIEKEISLQSEAFASLTNKKRVTWQNIQKALKKDEAAIEIVRINKFGVQKIVTDSSDVEKAPNFPQYLVYGLTDTVYYAALIVKKKSKQPELVLLKNGNDLEKKFVNYQKNAILYKREDAISYNEFWKPIAEKLKGIKKVYFSPDGVYNQISINTLQNPETKKYVLDEVELHLVTNTKDILAFGKSENKSFKADLLGYPIYDLQTENADESRKRELEADTTRAFANFQKVNLLPGTKKEVEDISKILKSKNYQLEVLTEKNATEENIKQVKSPKILHLSTHGFFIDSKEKNEKINPMLRSGLLLTGVSDYTRAEIKPDTEDGVLTALEAANLDLDETDLVVLSACETGLGDVKAGEGVYGLQRAFKVAGAKTIVMSMWKVDDAVTQKLMTTFYQKFAEYDNARKAFKEAQSEIKKQYPEPYFWGAFVMTGE